MPGDRPFKLEKRISATGMQAGAVCKKEVDKGIFVLSLVLFPNCFESFALSDRKREAMLLFVCVLLFANGDSEIELSILQSKTVHLSLSCCSHCLKIVIDFKRRSSIVFWN